jgi:hypothetical protein
VFRCNLRARDLHIVLLEHAHSARNQEIAFFRLGGPFFGLAINCHSSNWPGGPPGRLLELESPAIKAIDLCKNVMNCSMYVVENVYTRQQ